jgi:5-methylthioadenosine/S-adenosylhomocysteine deaminase
MTAGTGRPNDARVPVDLLLTAAVVLTVDAHDSVLTGAAVAIDRGVIVQVGPVAEVEAQVAPRARVDLPDHLLMPGFVNAHTHLSMTMFRGFTDDLDLADFLGRIVPAEASMLDAATVAVGTRAAAVESVLGGVTSALDMYFFPDAALAAGAEVGLRTWSGPVVLDNEGIHALGPGALIDEPVPWLSAHAAAPGWRPVVAPHSVYTVSVERLRVAGELAAAHDAVLHIHAAETAAEVESCVAAHGRRPVELLDDLGLLGPRSVLAHGVHLTDAEIDRLAASGTTVAHCPASNLKLASGIARVPALLDAGVNVAIGTDGAATSNDLDMFVALRLAALLHKGVGGDPTAVPAHRALRMATLGGARAVGLDAQLGSVEVGKLADLVALDMDRPHLQPVFDPAAAVVYAAGRGDVTDVWVGGEQVVRDGRTTRVDQRRVTAELAGLAPRVLATLR